MTRQHQLPLRLGMVSRDAKPKDGDFRIPIILNCALQNLSRVKFRARKSITRLQIKFGVSGRPSRIENPSAAGRPGIILEWSTATF